MRVLLDTHIFIWWSSESERLPPNIFYLLEQPETVIYVSLISLWEIQIKNQLGKLLLSESLQDIFYRQSKNRISFLEVTPDHVLNLYKVPLHHKDPFDRLLISQALVEGLTMISVDQMFSLYDLPLLSG